MQVCLIFKIIYLFYSSYKNTHTHFPYSSDHNIFLFLSHSLLFPIQTLLRQLSIASFNDFVAYLSRGISGKHTNNNSQLINCTFHYRNQLCRPQLKPHIGNHSFGNMNISVLDARERERERSSWCDKVIEEVRTTLHRAGPTDWT